MFCVRPPPILIVLRERASASVSHTWLCQLYSDYRCIFIFHISLVSHNLASGCFFFVFVAFRVHLLYCFLLFFCLCTTRNVSINVSKLESYRMTWEMIFNWKLQRTKATKEKKVHNNEECPLKMLLRCDLKIELQGCLIRIVLGNSCDVQLRWKIWIHRLKIDDYANKVQWVIGVWVEKCRFWLSIFNFQFVYQLITNFIKLFHEFVGNCHFANWMLADLKIKFTISRLYSTNALVREHCCFFLSRSISGCTLCLVWWNFQSVVFFFALSLSCIW